MNKDIPLAKIWCELWSERQQLVSLPITSLECGVRIDWNDNMQVFITWHKEGKFNRVECRYTRLELERFTDADLTLTNAIRTLGYAARKRIEVTDE